MTDIPDFTKEKLKIVQESVDERYGHSIELQLANAGIRPDQLTRELIEVPAVFRAERDASFVIVKVEKNIYRSQFFYRANRNLAPVIRFSMTSVFASSPPCRYRPTTKPKKKNRLARFQYLVN